jgi:hypothetical protein
MGMLLGPRLPMKKKRKKYVVCSSHFLKIPNPFKKIILPQPKKLFNNMRTILLPFSCPVELKSYLMSINTTICN